MPKSSLKPSTLVEASLTFNFFKFFSLRDNASFSCNNWVIYTAASSFSFWNCSEVSFTLALAKSSAFLAFCMASQERCISALRFLIQGVLLASSNNRVYSVEFASSLTSIILEFVIWIQIEITLKLGI